MTEPFTKTETHTTRWEGTLDYEAFEAEVLAMLRKRVGLSAYASGLSLEFTILPDGGLRFALTQDHEAWRRDVGCHVELA